MQRLELLCDLNFVQKINGQWKFSGSYFSICHRYAMFGEERADKEDEYVKEIDTAALMEYIGLGASLCRLARVLCTQT